VDRLRPPLLAACALVAAVAVGAAILVFGESDDGPDDAVPPAERAAGEPFFGVNDSQLYASAQLGEEELAAKHAQAIADAGIELVRFSAAWRGEEPALAPEGQHVYNFQFLDVAVTTLAEHGLPFALTLTTAPVWAAEPAGGAACGAAVAPAVEGIDDFGAYAAAIARRYGPDGDFWREHPDLRQTELEGIEIWNEPNWNAYWCPEPNPETYADLFVVAAEAIRGVDPGIEIVTGGLTSVFAEPGTEAAGGMDANLFIERMMDRRPEIAQLADAIGFHTYDVDVAGILSRIAKFRAGLDRNGLGRLPIALNETGWPTEGEAFPIPEPERADEISELAEALWESKCDITEIAVYAWRTPEEPPGASAGFYGIADPQTAESYESAIAYSDAIERLRSERRELRGAC
jgi:hypothetical protein